MKNHLLNDGCLIMTHFQPLYFQGGTENHLSNNDSIGGMKNHLLKDGCLLVTYFQPVHFHGGIENRRSNDSVGGILKRTLPHYKSCFHCQVEKKDFVT